MWQESFNNFYPIPIWCADREVVRKFTFSFTAFSKMSQTFILKEKFNWYNLLICGILALMVSMITKKKDYRCSYSLFFHDYRSHKSYGSTATWRIGILCTWSMKYFLNWVFIIQLCFAYFSFDIHFVPSFDFRIFSCLEENGNLKFSLSQTLIHYIQAMHCQCFVMTMITMGMSIIIIFYRFVRLIKH